MRQAVFLDRDGVINKSIVRGGKPFAPTSLAEIEILPGVRDALSRLRDAGYLNVVVTNQPDISTGLQSTQSLVAIHKHLQDQLAIDAVFVCPHIDADLCECRKPKPGLLMQAASRWGIDLASSYMVGDRWRDIEAGQEAGCGTSFFIDYGYLERRPQGSYQKVSSLAAAADLILGMSSGAIWKPS